MPKQTFLSQKCQMFMHSGEYFSFRPYSSRKCGVVFYCTYSKTCLKRPLKKDQKIGFQDRLLLSAGQKYCRVLIREHSAILSTFIKLPFTIKRCVFLSGGLRQVLLY